MKHRTILTGLLAAHAIASAAFAGFSVTYSKITVAGFSGDVYTIVAVNDGAGTGTQIKGLEYFYSGSPAAFQVDDVTDPSGGDPDGIPDTVNLLSTSRTRIRVSATRANNVFVGVSPTNDFAQPNPYTAGATSFSGAIANIGGVTQATGAGFEIARIFLPSGGTGVFSGNLGGDIGSKEPFALQHIGSFVPPSPPIITPTAPTNVTFGTIVSNGAPFSTNVTVTDADPADVLSLSLGLLPATVSGVTITGTTGTSPRTFVVSGTVSYAANGTDVLIPLIASDNSFQTGNGFITLHVTPEPASLGAMSTLLLAARRKRNC